MEIQTKQYVKKPLFVDAVQVTEENFREIARWCQGSIKKADGSPLGPDEEPNPAACFVHVRVHAPRTVRQSRAFVGDWLLYTDRGYKVYNTAAFEASFDLAEADGKVQAVTPQV
jgi:hypothetical protein